MSSIPASFAAFAALCEQLSSTSSRLERSRLITDYLRTLGPEETEIATRLLVGRAFPEAQGRRLSLGGSAVWQALQRVGISAPQASWAGVADFGELVRGLMPQTANVVQPLTLVDVRDAFAGIAHVAGSGARTQRIERLAQLFRRATPLEAKYLAKIVIGEMRHGVQEGIVLDAIAGLAGLPPAAIRRAQQTVSDLGKVAALAQTNPASLSASTAQLFRPIKPMLAQTARDVAAAFAELPAGLALEWKLDGARVQIHTHAGEVRIFSRRLQEITRSLPDIATLVSASGCAATAIFEGEVIAVRDGRPLPFQELMRRFRRIRDVAEVATEVPVELALFDLLYLDMGPLLDLPTSERWQALQRARGTLACVSRLVPESIAAGNEFYEAALSAGHEGVMAKALDAPYLPGVRGKGWLKIKHSVTLDLVIIAADWGYGRRHGWLSNYHLAVRDPATGSFRPVGKTFKGPTDEEFRRMTDRLLQLRTREEHGTVTVRPEIVVEVKFDGIQKSTMYDCGFALRFARIVRVRADKTANDADTLDTLRRVFEQLAH